MSDKLQFVAGGRPAHEITRKMRVPTANEIQDRGTNIHLQTIDEIEVRFCE